MLRKTAPTLVLLCVLLLVVTAIAPVQAAEPASRYGELLSRVPAGANTLIMLDVEAIRNSLFVTNTPASEKAGRDHVNRFVFGAKELDRAVLAADLDLTEFIPVWETVLTETNTDVVLAELAQRQNGRVEQLGSMQAVWLPSNGYLVPFTSRTIGMRFPADRAYVAGWANHPALEGQNALSPYLREAASYPEHFGTEIIMALDLENAVDPGAVRQNLENANAVKNKGVDLDQLARVLASIRGVTLGVRVTTNVNGSLRIDFAEDVSMTESFAKALVLEKLAEFGASLEEIYQWEARVDKNTVFLSGTLSVTGLRRVLTLIDPPTPKLSGSDDAGSSTGAEATAQKTYDYYKALETLVNDVKSPDTKRIHGTGELAIWMDRYAKKIDRMPILGVDEQLVDFASVIAKALRDMALQFRGVGIEAGKLSRNPQADFYYGGGGWGARGWGGAYRGGAWGVVGAEKRLSDQTIAHKVGRANVSASRADLWRQIDDDMATARRELTKRYQMEF